MATVGAKNQPIVQNTDTFNPVSDINTLSNWVANNYASVKIIASPSTKSSITGADLFVGLTVYEQVNDLFWTWNGTSWILQPLGSVPRIELTRTTTGTNFFTNNTTVTLTGWTQTSSRGSMSQSNGVVTVPYAGRYNIYFQFIFAAQTTPAGTRIIKVTTGTSAITYQSSNAPVASNGVYMSIAVPGAMLSANETLTFAGFQSSGGALDWTATAGAPSKIVVEYVGP